MKNVFLISFKKLLIQVKVSISAILNTSQSFQSAYITLKVQFKANYCGASDYNK